MKPFWKSKTLWFNAIALGLGWLLKHEGVLQAAGVDAATATTILTVANGVLRMITTTGVNGGSDVPKAQ